MRQIGGFDEKSAIQYINLAVHVFGFHLFIGFDGKIGVSGKGVLNVFEGILKLLVFLVFHDQLDIHVIGQKRLKQILNTFFSEIIGLDLKLIFGRT